MTFEEISERDEQIRQQVSVWIMLSRGERKCKDWEKEVPGMFEEGSVATTESIGTY